MDEVRAIHGSPESQDQAAGLWADRSRLCNGMIGRARYAADPSVRQYEIKEKNKARSLSGDSGLEFISVTDLGVSGV